MYKQISQDQLNRIKGKYQAKYGIEMDDWSAINMNELEEGFANAFKVLTESKEQIETATKLVKGEVKTIRFNNPKEGFFFGLGIAMPILIVAIILIPVFCYLKMRTQKYEEQEQFLKTFGNATTYQELIQQGEIVEENGVKYLRLKPANKDLKIGKNYFYRKAEKDILIPLMVE